MSFLERTLAGVGSVVSKQLWERGSGCSFLGSRRGRAADEARDSIVRMMIWGSFGWREWRFFPIPFALASSTGVSKS